MTFYRKDKQNFILYKGVKDLSFEGDATLSHMEEAGSFAGNLQPYKENNYLIEYGFDLKYGYVLYTEKDIGFSELDMIQSFDKKYKIIGIIPYKNYIKLILEEVTT